MAETVLETAAVANISDALVNDGKRQTMAVGRSEIAGQ